MTKKPRLTIRTALTLFGLVAALAGIGWTVATALQDHSNVEERFPRLEEALVAYSLVAYRSARQAAPTVQEDSEYGGQSFSLQCGDTQWSTPPAAGWSLLDCFDEEVQRINEMNGETFAGTRLSPNADYWYRFEWRTVLGYPVRVRVEFDEDSPVNKLCSANAEAAGVEPANACQFPAWRFFVDGLQTSKTFEFSVTKGTSASDSAGNLVTDDEWVILLGDETMSVAQLEGLISRLFVQAGMTGGDIEENYRVANVEWLQRNRKLAERLLQAASDVPGLKDFLAADSTS